MRSESEQAAEVLGISPHTAKTQLRSIFDKTGVNGQSQLVSLVLSISSPGEGARPDVAVP